MSLLRLPEIIRKKRDGEELSELEIQFFVEQTALGTAQQCQIGNTIHQNICFTECKLSQRNAVGTRIVILICLLGAMLMALYIRGMSEIETINMTSAIMKSGKGLPWPSEWRDDLADKHSTGGVGDKTSLPLAPALAACGLKIPMLSGRGLEFTGGTLDKLESIPGFSVQLEFSQMERCLREAGCFIAGQTDYLAPADRELYKLRDVTATVDSDELTVASIVSKKVIEGISALVMDIKIGRAALFQTEERARKLGQQLVRVAEGLGVRTRVLFSRMDTPLGLCVGNALEVAETLEYLRGGGPSDLAELVTILGGELLLMKDRVKTLAEGQAKIMEAVSSGRALDNFEKMLKCQGVDEDTAQRLCRGDMWSVLPRVPEKQITSLNALKSGFIVDIAALEIAQVCQELGAGRTRAGQQLDLRVGVRLLVTVGDRVTAGKPWLEVHHASETLDPALQGRLQSAINVAPKRPRSQSRVIGFM